MKLPQSIQHFQTDAALLLKKGEVLAIEFSGPTYQIHIKDPAIKESIWVFMQLNNRGLIKDSFCSCEHYEDHLSCEHIAAAYLTIFNNHSQPLHIRYEQSIWKVLTFLYSQIAAEPDLLQKKQKNKFVFSQNEQQIFSIEALTADSNKQLKELLFTRPFETEETSIKFSNLTPDQIKLWKKGKATDDIKYIFSFWNDLGKWLQFLQEKHYPYVITFDYSSTGIPNFIHIDFEQIKLGFSLKEQDLPEIIPALATINSPLKVYDGEENFIKDIVFDEQIGHFHINFKTEDLLEQKPELKQKGIIVDRWVFMPNDGFYLKEPNKKYFEKILDQESVSNVFSNNFSLLKRFLINETIHYESHPLQYHLFFDSNWNLRIKAYLETPDDLQGKYSKLYDAWAYKENDGFYKIEGSLFPDVETVISKNQVSEFVTQNRTWLSHIEGFQTHLANIESQLNYKLSKKGVLTFTKKIVKRNAIGHAKEFGSWIYVKGQGFYSKISTPSAYPINPDISIPAEQISVFIKMNKEELRIIPQFFTKKCPLEKVGVVITLSKKNLITVEPEFIFFPEYGYKNVRIFDDYTYIENEGFCEIPYELRLPENYRTSQEIKAEGFQNFLQFELDKLRKFATRIDPKLEAPEFLLLVAEKIVKDEEAGKGWYNLQLYYQTERGKIPIIEFWTSLKQKQKFLLSKYGCIDLRNKRFDWIKVLGKNRLNKDTNILSLTTLELIRLNAFDEIEVQSSELAPNLLKELTEFKMPKEANIDGLQGQLRSYQNVGLQWLWFLYQHGLSGLLCDDMGLGKTHQSMALFAAVINEFKEKKSEKTPRFLVICPTSVIYHWQEKIKKFFPNLHVLVYHGNQRDQEELEKPYDVLLTSYGIWRMEVDRLSPITFEVAVFDEIQIAKNHNSRLHSALLNVEAQMCLGLTGTPIENRLRELKSLFDIVLPMYMPSDSDYKDFFVKPIERSHDEGKQNLLKRFIKPFVLRRKKEDVLLDLPEKTEEISYCDLTHSQAVLYAEVLSQSKEQVMRQVEAGEGPIPYIHIFAILSALKQICNHPASYLKQPEAYKSYTSGKWELFTELLSEARDSGQKVVVFSQYIAMLKIIELYLQEHGIGYAIIKGSTTNRAEQLERFNHDPSCEVFIGSLQASGLGVDLTAASIVIHYDRWWNAARENQATDRVHRIGQTRGVQVFKLVTKGTFEEKIDAMISRKKQLMEETVSVDDKEIIKMFNREEIMDLLKNIEIPDKL